MPITKNFTNEYNYLISEEDIQLLIARWLTSSIERPLPYPKRAMKVACSPHTSPPRSYVLVPATLPHSTEMKK